MKREILMKTLINRAQNRIAIIIESKDKDKIGIEDYLDVLDQYVEYYADFVPGEGETVQ